MQREIEELKKIFGSNNVPVSRTWLEQCVEFCKSEILDQNYTINQLQQEVHQQWLVQDIRDIGVPVLPSGLSEKKYMILNGNYSLQVIQLVDISKPKYWQIQQIRKESALTGPSRNETIETIGTGKRVLQLSLTDGIQQVEAMEYKPIPILNINLPPGVKVRLSGPITIRRGRLMLEDHNITIIGGEVESLLIPNAAENILARALKLPENPNPQIVDVNLLIVNQDNENIPNRSSRQDNRPNNITNVRSVQSNSNERNASKESIRNQTTYSNASTVPKDDYPTEEDYEMLMAAERQLQNQGTIENCGSLVRSQRNNIDIPKVNKFVDPCDEEIEMLMEVERELENNVSNNNRKHVSKTPDLFEDDFDVDQIDYVLEMTTNKEKATTSNKKNETHQQPVCGAVNQRSANHIPINNPILGSLPDEKKSKTNLFDEFINEDDLFGSLDLDNLESLKNQDNNKSDIVSITKLLQSIQHVTNGSFKVRAKFKSIIEKLTLQKDEYKLTIMVEDSSNEMVCRVHSDVVSKWAGLTPVEIVNLKTSIFSQNVESKNKVEKALQNIKDRLLEVNHVMEIHINGKDSVPVIKDIFY